MKCEQFVSLIKIEEHFCKINPLNKEITFQLIDDKLRLFYNKLKKNFYFIDYENEFCVFYLSMIVQIIYKTFESNIKFQKLNMVYYQDFKLIFKKILKLNILKFENIIVILSKIENLFKEKFKLMNKKIKSKGIIKN